MKIAIRSLLYYWRTNTGVILGVALTSAILTGALIIGDSVKTTLHEIALARLGNTHFAMSTNNRFFSSEIGPRMSAILKAPTTSILKLRGMAINEDHTKQANMINILGVDRSFQRMTHQNIPLPGEDTVLINHSLAKRLSLKAGDEISLRIELPSILPRDAPLSERGNKDTIRKVFTVSSVLPDSGIGRFSLMANQITPLNVFVDLASLQKDCTLNRKANILLVSNTADGSLNLIDVKNALKRARRFSDFGLRVRQPDKNVILLESERIFLDPVFAEARPAGSAGALTYLVNSISSGNESTPYSFVTAISPSNNKNLSPVPLTMQDDEILLNSITAKQLDVKAGDKVSIKYYRLSASGQFIVNSADFSVFDSIKIRELKSERDRAPLFPGLTDADRCAGWNIGMPMDEELLKDKDNEKYWKQYRQTPKAFITLAVGQAMWGNRFGELTSIRFTSDQHDIESIENQAVALLSPSDMGFTFQPVRLQAIESASKSMDLGQLFIGMSLFLIIAALMLTGLLLSFGVQQRAVQIGTLQALGFSDSDILKIHLLEGGALAITGSVLGILPGILYTRILIAGLAGAWRGIVSNSSINMHVNISTILTGAILSTVCAFISMLIALRRQSNASTASLLSGSTANVADPDMSDMSKRNITITSLSALVVAILIAVISSNKEHHTTVMAFFSAGSLLLIAGLGLFRLILDYFRTAFDHLCVISLGLRNASRRSANSVAIAGLLSCGCFLVFSVACMQEDVTDNADKRWSGTGGFELFAKTTVPILSDLNTADSRIDHSINMSDLPKDTDFIPLKVKDGDDAGCLNLNNTMTPRLFGLNQNRLSELGAFVRSNNDIWELLNNELPEGVIPALVGDSDTASWGLKMKVDPEDGAILKYKNERGKDIKIKLVGKLPMRLSVFQGSVLISSEAFVKHFPYEYGYRAFLIDTPTVDAVAVSDLLTSKLARQGATITSTTDRLQEFYQVESTYLSMFLVLGGLGLLLGTAGMGIVVSKNILERRSELALLSSAGFRDADIQKIIIVEHALILTTGIVGGIITASVAIWPAVNSPAVNVPIGIMMALLAGIIISGGLVILAATKFSLQGSCANALRSD